MVGQRDQGLPTAGGNDKGAHQTSRLGEQVKSAGRVKRPDGDGVADTSTWIRTTHETSRPEHATTKPHGVFCFARNKYGQS